jgi:hypothetical protein
LNDKPILLSTNKKFGKRFQKCSSLLRLTSAVKNEATIFVPSRPSDNKLGSAVMAVGGWRQRGKAIGKYSPTSRRSVTVRLDDLAAVLIRQVRI